MGKLLPTYVHWLRLVSSALLHDSTARDLSGRTGELELSSSERNDGHEATLATLACIYDMIHYLVVNITSPSFYHGIY